MRYNDRFEYTITTNDALMEKEAFIPSFLILTLVENIIEHAVYNQFKNERFFIHFDISETTVTFHIKHEHQVTNSALAYQPEYRKRIIKWQDQIKLLNSTKKHHIKKDVTFIKTNQMHLGTICLTLPNLSQ